MRPKTVLAIDPGRTKCGLALAVRNQPRKVELLWHRVIPTADLIHGVEEAKTQGNFELVIVGGGTTSHEAVARLRSAFAGLSILVVDETDTTLHARERYWEHFPRRGWRRLLPATLQVPPDPVDDFAALVLAERVLIEP
jgi:RNase H-fold protein (predicted Holliday junction resolvase)